MKLPAVLLVGLTACTLPSSPASRFTGTLTPTIPSPLCSPSRASLQLRETGVVFAPDEGTWILEGFITADNTISADKSRIGPNNQVYETSLQARRVQNDITGTYKTPRCSFDVALTSR